MIRRRNRGIRFDITNSKLQLAEKKMYEGFDALSLAARKFIEGGLPIKSFLQANPSNSDAREALNLFNLLVTKTQEVKKITDVLYKKIEGADFE